MGRGVWTFANASATITTSGLLAVTGNAVPNSMSPTPDPNNPLLFVGDDGTGTNILEVAGIGSSRSWNVTGPGAGNAASGAVTFVAIQNLRGSGGAGKARPAFQGFSEIA